MSKSVPAKDADLLPWSTAFNAIIVASGPAYVLTTGEVTAYTAAHTLFATRYATSKNETTRTKGTISAKTEAATALRRLANSYAKAILANVNITDQMKLDLGLHLPVKATPVPAPTVFPSFAILSVRGNTVTTKIQDPNSDKKAKPAGVKGASIFSCVQPAVPTGSSSWKFEGSTTKNKFDVVFDSDLAPGTRVWLCAFYFNPTSASGPASDPVGTNLQGGGVSLTA